jgi:NTE family protein
VIPLRVVAADLDTGEEVVFASGPLQPALLASSALPGIYPPIRHDGRTLVDGAVVDTVPLWHALAGPIDRIYLMNVAGDLLDRPLRSPIDVAVRAFAISRKQRFELEVRGVPESVELVQLPAPVDERELFDFAGGQELIDAAYELANQALDDTEATRTRRRQVRRSWWRRDVG